MGKAASSPVMRVSTSIQSTALAPVKAQMAELERVGVMARLSSTAVRRR